MAIDAWFSEETLGETRKKAENINEFVKTIEDILGFSIPKVYKEKPLGDVNVTYANIDNAYRELHWEPKTDLKTGLTKFIEWYKNNYK